MYAQPQILQDLVSESDLRDRTERAREQIAGQCSVEVPWNGSPTPTRVREYLNWFEQRVREEPSAGKVPILFAAAVVAVIGKRTELSEAERETVLGLCKAIDDRPLPTVLWADFVRAQLDRPQVITRIFSGCVGNARQLEERIKAVFLRPSLLGEISGPIVVFGYSATMLAALRGICTRQKAPLEIITPELQLRDRAMSDGERLASELKKIDPAIVCRVVSSDTILKRLRSGQVQLLLMGCKVIGLRRTGELEVVNSTTAERFAEVAHTAGVSVSVIAGSYKLWPTLTYERYRPEIVLRAETQTHHRQNGIVKGEWITWIASEDGMVSAEDFKERYRSWFTVENVPVASIRECLGSESKMASVETASVESTKIAAAIDARSRRLINPPKHFELAEAHYRELVSKPKWLKKNARRHVAIVRDEVVCVGRSFQEVARQVRPRYGYGPIFIAEVSAEPMPASIGSPAAS